METYGPLLSAKFNLTLIVQCDAKPKNQPLSRNNTDRAALQAVLLVINAGNL